MGYPSVARTERRMNVRKPAAARLTVDPNADIKPIRDGFTILRPNVAVRNVIVDIVRQGDYRCNNTGWSGRTGRLFWGGMYNCIGELVYIVELSRRKTSSCCSLIAVPFI